MVLLGEVQIDGGVDGQSRISGWNKWRAEQEYFHILLCELRIHLEAIVKRQGVGLSSFMKDSEVWVSVGTVCV